MPETVRAIAPLDWQRLVDETAERRKENGLTKREHAALAGVSAPTMGAFDRGEDTLTLAKAFAILRVVGLLEEPTPMGVQERFLRESIERWKSLVEPLATRSPARFPDGYYRIDYALAGDLRQVTISEFREILGKAVTRHTGWPVFMMMARDETAPREVDGAIETWLPPSDIVPRNFNDAAHCDYWRGLPTGRMFLMRGYQEDGQETFPPGTIFDSTLPIWRMGEVMLHAANLARLLGQEGADGVTIKFRALYTGLQGRQLKSWANPLSGMLMEGRPSRSDEVLLEAEVPVAGMEEQLAGHLLPLVSALFERFDAESVSLAFVQNEVHRLMANRF